MKSLINISQVKFFNKPHGRGGQVTVFSSWSLGHSASPNVPNVQVLLHVTVSPPQLFSTGHSGSQSVTKTTV
jgi:hypothetical protein